MARGGFIWDEEALAFLKDNYLCMTDKDIAQCLNCAESTVGKKINDLGIKRPKRYKSSKVDLIFFLRKWEKDQNDELKEPDTPVLQSILSKRKNKKLKLRKTYYEKLSN